MQKRIGVYIALNNDINELEELQRLRDCGSPLPEKNNSSSLEKYLVNAHIQFNADYAMVQVIACHREILPAICGSLGLDQAAGKLHIDDDGFVIYQIRQSTKDGSGTKLINFCRGHTFVGAELFAIFYAIDADICRVKVYDRDESMEPVIKMVSSSAWEATLEKKRMMLKDLLVMAESLAMAEPTTPPTPLAPSVASSPVSPEGRLIIDESVNNDDLTNSSLLVADDDEMNQLIAQANDAIEAEVNAQGQINAEPAAINEVGMADPEFRRGPIQTPQLVDYRLGALSGAAYQNWINNDVISISSTDSLEIAEDMSWDFDNITQLESQLAVITQQLAEKSKLVAALEVCSSMFFIGPINRVYFRKMSTRELRNSSASLTTRTS